MSFIYVASPYTHADPEVMERRFNQVSEYTAKLIRQGIVAYSPIAHSHPLAIEYDLPGDFYFWFHQNYGMLEMASKMVILCLDGWDTSRGVIAEIEFCEHHGIEIEYVIG